MQKNNDNKIVFVRISIYAKMSSKMQPIAPDLKKNQGGRYTVRHSVILQLSQYIKRQCELIGILLTRMCHCVNVFSIRGGD